MIPSNELRLGNYVEFEGRIFQIHCLAQDMPFLNTDEFGVGVVSYGHINPISLTSATIQKCGFVNKGDWFYKADFILGFLTTEDNLQTEYKLSGAVDQWKLLNIKFLHQLQNLYFALTGEELEINQKTFK